MIALGPGFAAEGALLALVDALPHAARARGGSA